MVTSTKGKGRRPSIRKRWSRSRRQPIDPMAAPARGIKGWRMAVVAGGASFLGIVLFGFIASGFEPLMAGMVIAVAGVFLGFCLIVMYLTGAL